MTKTTMSNVVQLRDVPEVLTFAELVASEGLSRSQAQAVRAGLRWAVAFGVLKGHQRYGRYVFDRRNLQEMMVLSIIVEVVKKEHAKC